MIALLWLFMQVKKHIKGGEGHEGGIFTVEAPLHASNVQVLDPGTGYGCTFYLRLYMCYHHMTLQRNDN